jgi:hypothetical protein
MRAGGKPAKTQLVMRTAIITPLGTLGCHFVKARQSERGIWYEKQNTDIILLRIRMGTLSFGNGSD